jgi:hypothetical protein
MKVKITERRQEAPSGDYNTPIKKDKHGPQVHPAMGHQRRGPETKRKRREINTSQQKDQIQDKRSIIFTSNMKRKVERQGAKALGALVESNKGRVCIISKAKGGESGSIYHIEQKEQMQYTN